MRAVAASTAIVLAISFAGQAFAAQVRATGGQVLINRGEGYKMVAGTVQGGPGDTIVANPGGSAQIVYPDGCVVDVLPGSVAVINAQSPCSAANTTVTTGSATTTSTTSRYPQHRWWQRRRLGDQRDRACPWCCGCGRRRRCRAAAWKRQVFEPLGGRCAPSRGHRQRRVGHVERRAGSLGQVGLGLHSRERLCPGLPCDGRRRCRRLPVRRRHPAVRDPGSSGQRMALSGSAGRQAATLGADPRHPGRGGSGTATRAVAARNLDLAAGAAAARWTPSRF